MEMKMLPYKSDEELDMMTEEVIEAFCRANNVPDDFRGRDTFTKVIRGGFVAMQQVSSADYHKEQHAIGLAVVRIVHELEPSYGQVMLLHSEMMEQVDKWEEEPNKW